MDKMKVKCPCYPWCEEVLETEKDLGNHLFSKHKLDEVCMVLAGKIFKIHEKIEELENIKSNAPRVLTDIVEIQNLLKSLL